MDRLERQDTRMAISKQWFSSVRRKFHRSSHTILPATKTSTRSSSEETASFEEDIAASPTASSFLKKDSTKGDTAATKIQAFFRGHLVRTFSKPHVSWHLQPNGNFLWVLNFDHLKI
jgi:hypothetical protein